MAIKFPTKKSAPKIEPKKVNKKVEEVEEDEIEDTEEEEAAEEEEAEEEEEDTEAEETEEEEEDTEEEADEEESDEEEEEADDDEEEEDEKPVKKGKVLVKKPVKVVAKKIVSKKVVSKKGIKTGSLSSFGQKATVSKESFPFKIQIGEELLTCDVPGKKPSEEGRLSREQLISIATFALNKATGKESTKKDVELIFKVFEGVIKQVTDDFSITFCDKQLRKVYAPERAYPALRGEYATLVPAHYEVHFRRICHAEDLQKIPIKAGKDKKPLQKKDGSYIPVKVD